MEDKKNWEFPKYGKKQAKKVLTSSNMSWHYIYFFPNNGELVWWATLEESAKT